MAKDTETFDRGPPDPRSALTRLYKPMLIDLADTGNVVDAATSEARQADSARYPVRSPGRRTQPAATLAEADRRDVAAQTGGTNTANWLAHETKLTRPEATPPRHAKPPRSTQRDQTRVRARHRRPPSSNKPPAITHVALRASRPRSAHPKPSPWSRRPSSDTPPSSTRTPYGSWDAGSGNSSTPTPQKPTKQN